MIPEIFFSIPPDAQSGPVSQINGEPSGGATYDPPSYDGMPLPVLCDIPCLGKVYSLPIQHAPLWVCSREKKRVQHDKGIWNRFGGFNSQGMTSTIEYQTRVLEIPVELFLPNDVARGTTFWRIHALFEIPYVLKDGYNVSAVPLTSGFLRDSVGTKITPCDAEPFVTYEQWQAVWNDPVTGIFPRRNEHIGEPGWIESVDYEWAFDKITPFIPETGTLLPIYAGCMGLLSGLLSGNNGGGVMGLLSMASVMAFLQGVSSSSAAASGRVLKNADGEDSFEGY